MRPVKWSFDDFIKTLSDRVRSKDPILLPVIAEEGVGRNKIPFAMGIALSEKIGWRINSDVYQNERIGRTNSSADHRLAFNPTFRGPILDGQDHVLLDDTLTMGGTLASLRGCI